MKKLNAEIKASKKKHKRNFLSFNAKDNNLPVGSRPEAYIIIITLELKRLEDHCACVEMKTTIVSHYHDTFTMKIPSRRVDKKK